MQWTIVPPRAGRKEGDKERGHSYRNRPTCLIFFCPCRYPIHTSRPLHYREMPYWKARSGPGNGGRTSAVSAMWTASEHALPVTCVHAAIGGGRVYLAGPQRQGMGRVLRAAVAQYQSHRKRWKPYAESIRAKFPRQMLIVKHRPNNAQRQPQWMRRRTGWDKRAAGSCTCLLYTSPSPRDS